MIIILELFQKTKQFCGHIRLTWLFEAARDSVDASLRRIVASRKEGILVRTHGLSYKITHPIRSLIAVLNLPCYAESECVVEAGVITQGQ